MLVMSKTCAIKVVLRLKWHLSANINSLTQKSTSKCLHLTYTIYVLWFAIFK